jgi:hypothetical protein
MGESAADLGQKKVQGTGVFLGGRYSTNDVIKFGGSRKNLRLVFALVTVSEPNLTQMFLSWSTHKSGPKSETTASAQVQN